MPVELNFNFIKGVTYLCQFTSSFLDDAIIQMKAIETKDIMNQIIPVLVVAGSSISTTLPSNLKRGVYEYDLEINRNGECITEFKGVIRVI